MRAASFLLHRTSAQKQLLRIQSAQGRVQECSCSHYCDIFGEMALVTGIFPCDDLELIEDRLTVRLPDQIFGYTTRYM